jgi:hypothetical protein
LPDLIRDLRDENATRRVKAKELETALAAETARATKAETDGAAALTAAQAAAKKDLDDAVAAAKAEAETHKTTATTAANERIIRAELKAEAIKAGMVDLDGLKLLDTSKVTLGEDGEVQIPDKFFEDAKKAKPWLFGTAGTSTSSTTEPPKPGTPGAKAVKDMTPEERKVALKALGVTRT